MSSGDLRARLGDWSPHQAGYLQLVYQAGEYQLFSGDGKPMTRPAGRDRPVRRVVFYAILPILSAPFILLAPVYLRGKALFWGTPLLQFIPWWDYAWEALSAGHLPLWNPYLGMGARCSQITSRRCSLPPTWWYFLLGGLGGRLSGWPGATLAAWRCRLTWPGSGLGMAWLARRLGLGGLAMAVAGLSYGLSSYLSSRGRILKH